MENVQNDANVRYHCKKICEYNMFNFEAEDCPDVCIHHSGGMKDGKQSFALVEFKGHRRDFFLNYKNLELKINNYVVVTIETGFDIGKIVFLVSASEDEITKKYNKNINKTIARIATEKDLDNDYRNKCDEDNVIEKSNLIAESYGLDMKVTDAEWQLDKQKLIIFFIAPQRVDFRELVKDLARQFKTRIELRQISAREEAKRLSDGVGSCGQKVCCTSFLFEFNKVSIEQAKLQQLSSNVAKLSGNCRRIKCCVAYENETYEEELAKYPPIRSTIETKEGIFLLTKIDFFKGFVTLFNQVERKMEVISVDELNKYVKAGKVTYPLVEATSELDSKIIVVDDDVVIEDEF